MKNLVRGFILLLVLIPGRAHAIDSVRLTDVIRSNGTGSIDLFKDVTAEQLEQFRSDNQGVLIFAVDVNEDASGTESSTSQGIALGTVSLTVTYGDGSQAVYDLAGGDCFTETQALLAEDPGTLRRLYYTLLGESGSNRVTAGNVVQDEFDSTLKIETSESVYDPAAGKVAVSAILDIVLLETNTSLGDPEAFYDFSNGFEDLALVNSTDGAFLDDYAAGQEEAPAVIETNPDPVPDPMTVETWNYFPSSSSYYIVGYEDLYPNVGDYDFNDLTVAYQVRYGLTAEGGVASIQGSAYLLTRGAAYSHDWRLRIALPEGASGSLDCTTDLDPDGVPSSQDCSSSNPTSFTGEIDIEVFADTVAIFPDPLGSPFVNTRANQEFVRGPRSSFTISFDTPVAPENIGPAPFDPYLFIIPTGQTVQLLQVNPAFKDENGYPFGMLLPDDWSPPVEHADMRTAYPSFQDYVDSAGSQDVSWYNFATTGQAVAMPTLSLWAW